MLQLVRNAQKTFQRTGVFTLNRVPATPLGLLNLALKVTEYNRGSSQCNIVLSPIVHLPGHRPIQCIISR